jgi:uncharacterized protein YgiM (DUF1202 family)
MTLTHRRVTLGVGLVLMVMLITHALTGSVSAQGNSGGRLRFVHVVPGAPAVDISIDKTVAVRALGYASASRFINVPAGDHAISVTAGGRAVFQGKVSVAAAQAQTLIFEGTATAVEMGVYEDDLGPVAPGNTRLTASHAIKGGPAVDVLRGDGSPLIQGLKYAVPYGAFDIPATALSIAIVPAGSDVNSAILKVDNLPLVAGTHNRLIALGTLEGEVKPSFLLLTAAADAENPAEAALLRLVHAVPGAPAVDVYVGDKLIAPALAFGSYTPHLALAAGSADVAIRAAGSGASGTTLATAKLTLAAGKAQTLVVAGVPDSLKVLSAEDNISALKPTTARLHLINATGDGTATLKIGQDVNVAASAAKPDVKGTELNAGIYDLAISVDQPSVDLKSSQPFSGGVLYDIVVAGSQPDQLIIAPTGLNEQANSAPGVAPVAVAQASTAVATMAATEAVTGAATLEVQPTMQATAAPTQQPTLVPQPTVEPPTAQPEPPTEVPAEPTATPLPPTIPPQPTKVQGIIATVQTNEGVNLKIREFPSTTARTLALVPSGATLVVDGVSGPVQPTGQPTFTPQPTGGPTATLSSQDVTIDAVWLFVTWQTPDGGNVTGWVNAQYVRITRNGRPVRDVAEIYTFKVVPPTTPGEVNSSSVTPVALDVNRTIGTITVDEGRNLQLRRTPGIDGESLALIPAGAEVTVISKTEVKSQGGVVGEPASTIWLFVRYDTDTGAITGWINQQYVKLSRNQRAVAIADVPTATDIQRGEIQGNATAVKPPAPPGLVATVDKIDPGANLQLRNQPNANAESLALIPSGSELQVQGRNGDGNWLFVQYEDKQGWINQQFVTVTKSGKPIKISDITNITSEPDTTDAATPGPSATPTALPTVAG